VRPALLDLYCCQGGSSVGYDHAGFRVVGVDIDPQPRYPFQRIQDDALNVLRWLVTHPGWGMFTAVHASPPCQRYSDTQRIQDRKHPDLIAETRELLEQTGLPYVIENVEGARSELRDPVMLCGAMFGLRTYRHRLFETNFPLEAPEHPEHIVPQAKMGRPVRDGEFIQCVGNFSNVPLGREAMQMPWATREGLREAIPPPYTEHVGGFLMAEVRRRQAVAA